MSATEVNLEICTGTSRAHSGTITFLVLLEHRFLQKMLHRLARQIYGRLLKPLAISSTATQLLMRFVMEMFFPSESITSTPSVCAKESTTTMWRELIQRALSWTGVVSERSFRTFWSISIKRQNVVPHTSSKINASAVSTRYWQLHRAKRPVPTIVNLNVSKKICRWINVAALALFSRTRQMMRLQELVY